VERILESHDVLPEPPDILDRWRTLVKVVGVTGTRSHDARLVATILANGITHILTFDTADFAGFPGITAIHPRDVPTPAQ
jgi:predicted nucleic acid-binding protein